MEKGKIQIIYLIIFCLSSLHFFDPVFIPSKYLTYFNKVIILVSLFIVITNLRNIKNASYSTPFFILLIAISISGLSATIFWSQSIIKTYISLLVYFSYLIYFLLTVWKPDIKDIERIIVIMGIVYIFVYATTFILYPTPTFSRIVDASVDRGFERIRVNGKGFLFLFSFYTLNRYLLKRKLGWLFLYVVSLFAVIMTLTRSLIFVSLVMSALFILRSSRNINKIIAIIIIAFGVLLITKMEFYQLLMDKTSNQLEAFENDIRLRSARYYLIEFSPNIFAKVFGNGQMTLGTSYGKFVRLHLELGLGYYQSDVGYIGLYSKFGLLAILAYLIIIISTIKISVPDEYLYGKYYLYFIFLSSIIINAPFNVSFITSIAISAYVLQTKDLSH